MNGTDRLDSCSTCRFFVAGAPRNDKRYDGTCRFSPPMNYHLPSDGDEPTSDPDEYGIVTLTIDDRSYVGWPAVLRSDWCGQHENAGASS